MNSDDLNFGFCQRVKLLGTPYYNAVIVYDRELSMAWLEAEAV